MRQTGVLHQGAYYEWSDWIKRFIRRRLTKRFVSQRFVELDGLGLQETGARSSFSSWFWGFLKRCTRRLWVPVTEADLSSSTDSQLLFWSRRPASGVPAAKSSLRWWRVVSWAQLFFSSWRDASHFHRGQAPVLKGMSFDSQRLIKILHIWKNKIKDKILHICKRSSALLSGEAVRARAGCASLPSSLCADSPGWPWLRSFTHLAPRPPQTQQRQGAQEAAFPSAPDPSLRGCYLQHVRQNLRDNGWGGTCPPKVYEELPFYLPAKGRNTVRRPCAGCLSTRQHSESGGPGGARASDRSQAGWDLLYVISTGTLAKQIYKIVSRRISFYLSRVNLKHKSHVFKYHHVLVFYDISEIRLWECSVLQMLGELKLGKERSWCLLRALWVWSSMPGVRLQTHVRLA